MRLVFLILFFVTLAGCAATVVYDFDKSANFLQDQTFEFESSADDSIQSLDRSRIRNAIAFQLKNKGFLSVDSGASLTVRYSIAEEIRIETTGVTYGVGMSRNRMGLAMQTPVRAREVKEGKLIVEMVETSSKRVIWRAASQKRLTEQMSPEKRTQLVNELVKEMFENYPPQNKK